MASLFELAGSVKEAIFAALHAVTAKPFRVAPPEAVVYQVLIILPLIMMAVLLILFRSQVETRLKS
jgi:hypothetical protein